MKILKEEEGDWVGGTDRALVERGSHLEANLARLLDRKTKWRIFW